MNTHYRVTLAAIALLGAAPPAFADVISDWKGFRYYANRRHRRVSTRRGRGWARSR